MPTPPASAASASDRPSSARGGASPATFPSRSGVSSGDGARPVVASHPTAGGEAGRPGRLRDVARVPAPGPIETGTGRRGRAWSGGDHPVPDTTDVRRDQPRTYVLDTSVLLADPAALTRFDEHEVVLPVVVISELEGKRHHPELGYFARSALRMLDELRVQHGRLDAPVPIGDAGGTLRVELNHTDAAVLPAGFRLGDNDSRILAVALNLSQEGRDVTLVSKDLPMRVKASAVGLVAEEYRAELVPQSGWTGVAEVEVAGPLVDQLYDEGVVDVDEARDLPVPCRCGDAVRARQRARSGGSGQAGAPRPRRPRGVRPARAVRRAAGGPRPAARPRRRDHLARWPGRHRQVRARAVRRAGGRARAPPAQEGRGLPPAVRRRRARSSATCRATSRRR